MIELNFVLNKLRIYLENHEKKKCKILNYPILLNYYNIKKNLFIY